MSLIKLRSIITSPPDFLATKTYIISVTGPNTRNATVARVAAIVGDDQGNRETCTVAPIVKSCSVVP